MKKVQVPNGRGFGPPLHVKLRKSQEAALAAGEQDARAGRQLFALRGKHGRLPMG